MVKDMNRREAMGLLGKILGLTALSVTGAGCVSANRISPQTAATNAQLRQDAQERTLEAYQADDFARLADYVDFMPALLHVCTPQPIQGKGAIGWRFQFSGYNYNAPKAVEFTDGEYLFYQKQGDNRFFHQISLTPVGVKKSQRIQMTVSNLGGA
jgi:hypothetical protein